MPRRSILTSTERTSLLAFPTTEEDLIQHYTFNEQDLSVIRQHRGGHNRLGFAVQLCYLRYPGCVLPTDAQPPEALLSMVARQLDLDPILWSQYAKRPETRREHFLELQAWLGLTPFGTSHARYFVYHLSELAQQTDRGMALATALLVMLRQQHIIVPSIDVIERVCTEALTQGTRKLYEVLIAPLSEHQRQQLDNLLLIREGTMISWLSWLRQSPGAPNTKHIMAHIERLRTIENLALPEGLERSVHQSRLLKIAREGGQMTAQHLRDLESFRRYATLVAVVLDTRATLIDETIDMHDRMLGMLFNRAKRHHSDRFQQSGKTINDKLRLYSRIGRALVEAKQNGSDPFVAIESILPWEIFAESVTETEKLAPSQFRLSSADRRRVPPASSIHPFTTGITSTEGSASSRRYFKRSKHD